MCLSVLCPDFQISHQIIKCLRKVILMLSICKLTLFGPRVLNIEALYRPYDS